jgi:hypothetical protein
MAQEVKKRSDKPPPPLTFSLIEEKVSKKKMISQGRDCPTANFAGFLGGYFIFGSRLAVFPSQGRRKDF